MWIVTGGAGFIVSALVCKLNEESYTDLLIVDREDGSPKRKNVKTRRFADYLEAYDFKEKLLAGKFSKVEGIVHFGACSSTTEKNEAYLTSNNYEYTKALAQWTLSKGIPFIYASSAATYG